MWPYDEVYFKGIHLARYAAMTDQRVKQRLMIEDAVRRSGPMTTLAAAIAETFRKAARAVVAWNRKRRIEAQLRALTDRQLDDIGLTRGDIEAVALGKLRRPVGSTEKAVPSADIVSIDRAPRADVAPIPANEGKAAA